jgi:hypothetical protein
MRQVQASDENTPRVPPVSIETLTLRYIPDQDRFRVDAKTRGNNDFLRLWLTRRLVDRLVPQLFSSMGSPEKSTVSDDIRQSVAQRKAMAHKQKVNAVSMPESAPEWLVREVKLSNHPRGVRVVFVGPKDTQAAIFFGRQQLRQWLSIVRHTYGQAGWSVDVFPEWMNEEHGSSVPKDRILN